MSIPVTASAVKYIEPLRALIIDDSAFDRQLIKRQLLRTWSLLTIEEAFTVEAGLAMLERAVYDIVLIDFNLPDGNGHEIIGSIMQHQRGRHGATILLSGSPASEIAGQTSFADKVIHLEKRGLDRASLLHAILDAKRMRAFDMPPPAPGISQITAQGF